jgi:hypothetical protein
MKTSIINARVDTPTKKALENIGSENDKPISAVVRDAISFYIENKDSLNNYQVEEAGTPIVLDSNFDDDFSLLKSWILTRFLYWIMEKKIDPRAAGDIDLYNQFIGLISKMEGNRYFPEDIMIEFRKVYIELYQYNNGPEYKRQFTFRFPNSYVGFDYSKLNLFMKRMRYDDDGVLTIYNQ